MPANSIPTGSSVGPFHGHLSNPNSDRVRSVARLAARSGRRRAGRFLAEGPQAVREALPAAAVDELFMTGDAAQRHPDILASAAAAAVPVRRCTEPVLAAVAGTVHPQGMVAACRPVDVPAPDLLAAAPRPGSPALFTVLAQARDPGNAGTVIRASDAAGATGVVLTVGSVDLYNPKCVRASAGSLFHLPVAIGAVLPGLLASIRDRGVCVLAADGSGDTGLDDLMADAYAGTGPLTGPVAWVFGNEAWGMGTAERAAADLVVRVPIYGRAESLNLASAAAVCLHGTAQCQRLSGR
ncbi:MAG: RNA methyltransferase [Micrococcales bacterium]|nr:MAG: RNA methyltransferase [Micrococcales bacterium]